MPEAVDGQANLAASVRTVESLYQALSRQDFTAARALFAGAAADQFDPAFFRQFTRVEVADLQPTARSAASITLDGVVSFHYLDGSIQKESRTFTLDTNSDPPRVVASAFGTVVRPRGPHPEPEEHQKGDPWGRLGQEQAGPVGSGGTAEGDVGELELGFIKGLAAALLLPVVDHFGGLVENLDALVVGDPALAFEFTLEGFPGIFAGPEKVGGEGAGAAPTIWSTARATLSGNQRIFSRKRPSSALGV